MLSPTLPGLCRACVWELDNQKDCLLQGIS